MRAWLRRWLGIESLEHKLIGLLVGFGKLTPGQAEEIVSTVGRDYKLENDHGEEGKL